MPSGLAATPGDPEIARGLGVNGDGIDFVFKNCSVGKHLFEKRHYQLLAERFDRVVWRIALQFVRSHLNVSVLVITGAPVVIAADKDEIPVLPADRATMAKLAP
jgi:hypothetical protein